jgi:hypothetical protein
MQLFWAQIPPSYHLEFWAKGYVGISFSLSDSGIRIFDHLCNRANGCDNLPVTKMKHIDGFLRARGGTQATSFT